MQQYSKQPEELEATELEGQPAEDKEPDGDAVGDYIKVRYQQHDAIGEGVGGERLKY